MDKNKGTDLMETILQTPQPTACSTVRVKKKSAPRHHFSLQDCNNELSFEMQRNLSIGSAKLEQQRILASESLFRSSNVGALPSKYFRPSDTYNDTASSSIGILSEGTISDSDLLQLPHTPSRSTSTPRESFSSPRNSSVGNRLSLQNLEALSSKLKSNITLDNFLEEFNKSVFKQPNIPIHSDIFIPAEEAESELRKDEISWRNKHELPIKDSLLESGVNNDFLSMSKLSVGGYFKQKSDDISDLKEAISPEKGDGPVPLIDITNSSCNNVVEDVKVKENDKSLSVSVIAKFLADTDETPRRLVNRFENFIADKGKKSSVAPIAHKNIRHSKNSSSDDSSEIPVSKNSSYTSNYSENEAIKQIIDKENQNTAHVSNQKLSPRLSLGRNSVSPNNLRPTSTSSTRSSSSLSNLPDGKLPIESTRNEVIWGCVKVDKCVTQEFLIRNRSSKSLRISCSVSTHDFKIRRDNRPDSDHLNAAKFVLRGNESRSISVSFIPTKLGACVDEINFMPLDVNLKQARKQAIRLYGYGGHTNVHIQNITKDTGGKYLLSLGRLENKLVLEQNFIIRNSGCLMGFVYISFRAKKVFVSPNVNVIPNFFILKPNEEKIVTVVYTPSSSDIKVLQQNLSNGYIANLGTLEMVSGSEVNRFRLRRLCRKCLEKNIPIDSVSSVLQNKLKDEIIPSDLVKFKESPANIKEMLQLFNHDEIVLMVEQDPDQTLIPHYPDDSAMFQTICHESTGTVMDTTMLGGSCRLEPSSIIFTLPHKNEDILCLISETNKMLHFETAMYPKGLIISPSNGQISPGETVVLKVTLPRGIREKYFKVVVYVDNEKLDADVKVLIVNSSPSTFLE